MHERPLHLDNGPCGRAVLKGRWVESTNSASVRSVIRDRRPANVRKATRSRLTNADIRMTVMAENLPTGSKARVAVVPRKLPSRCCVVRWPIWVELSHSCYALPRWFAISAHRAMEHSGNGVESRPKEVSAAGCGEVHFGVDACVDRDLDLNSQYIAIMTL
jgi:hypothetical protein